MPSLADRVASLEADRNDIIETIEGLVEAHNILDARHERLFYKLQYVMDSTRVRRVIPGGVLDANGKLPSVEGTLTEFFSREGESYIAALKAQADDIQKQLAGQQAITAAVRDTLCDPASPFAGAPRDPRTGEGAGQAAPAGPRLVTAQA